MYTQMNSYYSLDKMDFIWSTRKFWKEFTILTRQVVQTSLRAQTPRNSKPSLDNLIIILEVF